MSAGNPSGYVWDTVSARYRDTATGKYVSSETVRGALDNAIEASAKNVRAITQQLRDGALSLPDWQKMMMQEIKVGTLSSTAAAKGGFGQMTQADYGRAGREIRSQYAYLQKMSEQIANGTQKLDGTLLRRAAMYAESPRKSYEAQRRAEMRIRGITQERNVIHSNDSCDGCLEADALGWSALGTLPLPGDRDCMSRCKCTLEYRAA